MSPTWTVPGAGYGAIGGATSAVVAPLIRDGLYDGKQTVTTVDNGNGTQTVATSYDNRVYNAATAAIAMLAGGAMAGALGRDANAAAGAAQNEALNNATGTKTLVEKIKDWAAWTYADVPGDTMRGIRSFLSVGSRNGQDAQSDPNRQIDPDSGPSNNTPTGVAPVTPIAALLCLETGGVGCGLLPLLGGAPTPPPGNAIYSSGNSESGSGGSGVGAEPASGGSVWAQEPTARGVTIESRLAKTEYSSGNGWYQVGAERNGYFDLVDFQKGNTLVSLKTVDTAGSTWLPRMEGVIDKLASSGATVDGVRANMVLDLRVQPGGSAAAQSLVKYGATRGVTVIVKVYP